ncbi:hypothetical protein FDF26_15425 [Clostridium botulinum]|nr:hypothetical protein [Clostridium botulinum]
MRKYYAIVDTKDRGKIVVSIKCKDLKAFKHLLNLNGMCVWKRHVFNEEQWNKFKNKDEEFLKEFNERRKVQDKKDRFFVNKSREMDRFKNKFLESNLYI